MRPWNIIARCSYKAYVTPHLMRRHALSLEHLQSEGISLPICLATSFFHLDEASIDCAYAWQVQCYDASTSAHLSSLSMLPSTARPAVARCAHLWSSSSNVRFYIILHVTPAKPYMPVKIICLLFPVHSS